MVQGAASYGASGSFHAPNHMKIATGPRQASCQVLHGSIFAAIIDNAHGIRDAGQSLFDAVQQFNDVSALVKDG
jgi:hypothetical protein